MLQNTKLSGGGSSDKFQKLPIISLIFLIFFEVSGGPFGIEDSVRAAGPLLALVGFLIFPFVWSIPEALITAEMVTMFPENGGYVIWVSSALGTYWGFQQGWMKWPSEGFNHSGLGCNTPRNLLPTSFHRYGIHCNSCRWLMVDLNRVNWGLYLNTLFWNLNYWDSISTLSGEVHDPGKTLPRALFYALILVAFGYFFPLLKGTGAISVLMATSQNVLESSEVCG